MPGDPVLFPAVAVIEGTSFTFAAGAVTFLEPGVYHVTYGLKVDKDLTFPLAVVTPTLFVPLVGSIPLPQGEHNFRAGLAEPIEGSQFMETVDFMVEVLVIGSILTFQNTSAAPISIVSGGAGISAFLDIERSR